MSTRPSASSVAVWPRRSTDSGHAMTRFEDGKIVEEFEVFDDLAMLKQFGIAEG